MLHIGYLLDSSQQLYEVGTSVTILQMRHLRHGEVKELT
jgi:hypothetical protein